jgi:magnesium transporter
MARDKIYDEVRESLEAVISRDSALGQSLWEAFIALHPADISEFLGTISKKAAQKLFLELPKPLKLDTFEELSDPMKGIVLETLSDSEKIEAFRALPVDELADLFDILSDDDLKKYLNMLAKDVRERVLSILKFEPDSAGGIMTTDVLTILSEFTVDQAIKLLQRVQPSHEIHQLIFIVDKEHNLLGHINLQDLVLHKPNERISNFVKKNELVVRAEDDQESVAKEMVRYGLIAVPVVSDTNTFLGVISSEELVDVLVEEAEEDVQRMASMPPMKYPYFEIPFLRLLYLRGYVLVAFMIAESFSGTLLRTYESTMKIGILYSFLPILMSVGGNSGSQTSAVVIQGMASGELTFSNMFRLLRRELMISTTLAFFLGAISFSRAYYVGGSITECLAIGFSLSMIVTLASMLGNVIPFVLQRFNIDPAFSAGPLLATFMDILGILIYCHVSNYMLSGIMS